MKVIIELSWLIGWLVGQVNEVSQSQCKCNQYENTIDVVATL